MLQVFNKDKQEWEMVFGANSRIAFPLTTKYSVQALPDVYLTYYQTIYSKEEFRCCPQEPSSSPVENCSTDSRLNVIME